MPNVRRCNLPRALVVHLEDRVRDREIPIGQLQLLSERNEMADVQQL